MIENIELQLDHIKLSINVDSGATANPALLNPGHPLHYVRKMKASTIVYLNKVCELYRDVGTLKKVVEYCGGIGLIPIALKPLIHWESWRTVELDPACEPCYQCPEADFILGSMYNPFLYPETGLDLVIMDHPTNTLPKMWREPDRVKLLKATADAKPRYWHITDVGYYWIHLANHWPIYQERFGVQVTRMNYHELFDRFMRENYGYKVVKWTVGGGAQYFLLEQV